MKLSTQPGGQTVDSQKPWGLWPTQATL